MKTSLFRWGRSAHGNSAGGPGATAQGPSSGRLYRLRAPDMARRSLRPHMNQIRGWVRQGRTDAWIAHQLEGTVQDIEAFKRQNDLAPDGEAPDGPGLDFDDEIDLRAEDDALIAAELEAAEAAREEEERRAAEEEARRGGGGRRRRGGRGGARPRGGRPAGPRRGGRAAPRRATRTRTRTTTRTR